MTGPAKEAALDGMIRGVIVPYVVLAVLLFIFGILFFKSPVRDINPDVDNKTVTGGGRLIGILSGATRTSFSA